MQREGGALDSFSEPIDLNQGSAPNTGPTEHSTSWDHMLSPVENYMLSPIDPRTNATDDAFCNLIGRDHGASSSSSAGGDDSKTDLGRSNLFGPFPLPGPISDNRAFGPPQLNIGNSSSGPPYDDYARDRHCFDRSDCSEINRTPTFRSSSSNLEAFTGCSSSSSDGNHDASGPSGLSFGTWGSSCKRKALEGSSGQCYLPGGSSSSDEHHHPFSGHSRGNLSISSGPRPGPFDLPTANLSSQSPGGGLTESPARNFVLRSNHSLQEPIRFDNSTTTPSRNLNAYSSGESRSSLTITMSPNSLSSQTHPYVPWNGPLGSRGGGLSGSGARALEEAINNNLEYSLNSSSSREDQAVDWSFVPENLLSSRNHLLGAQRVDPGSGGGRASLSSHMPPRLSSMPQNHQRRPEASSRAPFESGIRRGHVFRSFTSPPDEAGPSSGPRNRLDRRSPAFLIDTPGEDVGGWRSLAAVESRHRLLRQVLSAMRRGVHLHAEDYMLVDPFMSGFAELHDRHRDMRLDVDNMSYEELLALGERIGNVSTGLCEERIMGTMKHRKFDPTRGLTNPEPCCICQEDYLAGDDIGILDCTHEFHTGCIKQWLVVKNLCPICKTTALGI